MDTEFKKELDDKMDKAMQALARELNGLRTGRASVNLLAPVQVEAYGSRMPLSQVATVATPDAVTVTVQVWDSGMTKAVEKAISEANLGLNPIAEGQVIRINIPPLSQERRVELVKISHKYGENAKVSLRNIRKNGMDSLKKMEKDSLISEDEHRTHSEAVQKMTDDYVKKVDDKIKAKEDDIMKI